MLLLLIKILFLICLALCAAALGYHFYEPVKKKWTTKLEKEKMHLQNLSKLLIKKLSDREAYAYLTLSFLFFTLFIFIFIPFVWLKLISFLLLMKFGWNIPAKAILFIHKQRIRSFQKQLVETIALISNALKSGMSLMQAVHMVANESMEPTRSEFQHLISQQQLGQTLEEGLLEMQKRQPSDDFKLIVQSILTLKETGGNIAATFDTIAETMRERHKVTGKIQALTAQGLVQAVIVGSMPAALLFMFSIISPDYVAPLFETGLGWIALFLAFMLICIGSVWMKKIITIKV